MMLLVSDNRSYPKTGPQSTSESDEEVAPASSTADASLGCSPGDYNINECTGIRSRGGYSILSGMWRNST